MRKRGCYSFSDCFDWDQASAHDLIGRCMVTLDQIGQRLNFTLVDDKKKNGGTLCVNNYRYEKQSSFLDYLAGGCELSLMVSIDFTGSNGSPKDPKSLHYNAPGFMNEYEAAIRAVGTILSDYDADKVRTRRVVNH